MTAYDDIILSEGVAIDSGAAPVLMRMASGLIDLFLYFLVYIGLVYALGPLVSSSNFAMATAMMIICLVFSLVVLPGLVETLTRGLSVGKLAVGLRIVRDDGGPVTARRAFTRSLLGFFEVVATFGGLAVLIALMHERGKRLGDIMAGTYAMRTRGGRKALPPVAMPYSLANWSAIADVARLPDGLALTSRLFLGRVADMEPNARANLAHRIAAQLGEYVAPDPPAGTHPETFIAAVVATRRDRDYAAALRASATNHAEAERAERLPYGIPDVEN